jgi:hypothetical protein
VVFDLNQTAFGSYWLYLRVGALAKKDILNTLGALFALRGAWRFFLVING